MAELKILVPDGTTNYIINPSLRFDTSGWSSTGATISRSLDAARFGIASLKVQTGGSALREGAYYRVSNLTGVSDPLTVSTYVMGTGTVRIRLTDFGGGEWASRPVQLRANRWTRLEVSGRITGSDDVRLYVETARNSAQSVEFFVDGAQMERKAYATTYCDGDQPGCRWNIIEHGSISTRPDTTRAGGRWVKLAGTERYEPNLYFTVAGGLGMPPISMNTQSYALVPGAFFQGTKIHSRQVTFTFHAKNKSTLEGCEAALAELHRLRQFLLDLVKPDRTAGDEEFWLEYRDGDIPIRFSARYEAGLEGEWDIRNQWSNSFPLRLLAVSPMLVEDDQQVKQLGFREDSAANYILQRKDGQWSGMNGGFNGVVHAMTLGPRGELIVVGEFTVANNSVGAADPMIPANRIAWWDGEAWNQYGTGANNTIRSVSVAANGYVYVTGDFTSIGGVAANRVAYWNGSTWNAMGTGLNASGYAIFSASDGSVYVGGTFTQAGGATAYYCARWTGSWTSIGAQSGLNNTVRTITATPNAAQVFLGGAFTDENSDPGISPFNYVAEYDPTRNEFYPLGVGFDATVSKLIAAPSGRLYAAGAFTGSSDTQLVFLYTAYWNGAAWFSYGSGADDTVETLDIDSLGNILLGGDFARIGSDSTAFAALWNGSDYVSLDVELDAPSDAVLFGLNGDIYLAQQTTTARWARRTTVNNIGSASASPRIYIKGPATLRWVENQTTKKRVYADLTVDENEEVILDFAQATIRSNIRGNIVWGISPGSDIKSWTLVPGENVIAAMLLDDIGAQMQIAYTVTHWSVDATARAK